MTQRIHGDQLQALLIDVQDRLTPLIADHQIITDNIVKLIKGLKLLDIPLIANEQYPKGLGHTIAPIKDVLGDTPIFEKVTFSSCDDEATLTAIRESDRPQVLIFGVETHVCVLQTAMDLLDQGFGVLVVADAVGSRDKANKCYALSRMTQAGVVIVSTEMILFELCRSAKNPVFKEISALVK